MYTRCPKDVYNDVSVWRCLDAKCTSRAWSSSYSLWIPWTIWTSTIWIAIAVPVPTYRLDFTSDMSRYIIYDITYIYICIFINLFIYICQYISIFNCCHDPSVIFQSEVSTHWSCGWGQNPHRDRAADRAVLFTKFRSYQKYKFRSTSRHAEMFGFRMESSKGKVQHQAPRSSLVQSIWLSQCILISISSKSPANGIVFDLLIQT